ncbi:SubName: Full=Related to B2-aldehyde-forming enzyme {ECO:0000313/EMBL:CCA71087.1} [Serendipita indica DSM 11827]|uniref:Related to B2-aldehyde-forming enzyme n=1 Tax=Serendipita indica (strain DSM 11827) TaxID=1109443 RepID=G4TID7_SERID|nr:SubName: Full=Related to B2-aldehyde-forming enzyme {ECO:0000313/EMBL:CCA71087.1} [Serendipita indica DSM 11827]CCA71087.1 related to B2-aldehyde-forming enzyme [Serendipita indica DSM 11827]
MKSILAIPLLAALSVLAKDVHDRPAKRHHHELAARNNQNSTRRDETQNLGKRDFSGVATWYDVTTGQGYCGGYRSPGDYVVALNAPQMESQSVRCGDTITISANGRSAVATVWDECPPCAWGSLDLSAGLFQVFGDLGQGVIPISWYVGAGGPPQPPPQPTSTYVWTPDPTTSQPPPTSSSPPPSSSSTPSSSSSSSPTSSSTPDNTVQEVPSSTTSTPPENLNNANNAILQLAEILRLARNGAA